MRSFLCISVLVLETSFLRLMGWDYRLSGVGLEASVVFPRLWDKLFMVDDRVWGRICINARDKFGSPVYLRLCLK